MNIVMEDKELELNLIDNLILTFQTVILKEVTHDEAFEIS